MGHIYVDVEFSNPKSPELRAMAKALVDTGATFTVLPKELAKRLALEPLGKIPVRTASGVEILEEVEVRVKIGDRERTSPALVSEKIDTPLLGVVTLEILRLRADPIKGTLEELPLLLYLHRRLSSWIAESPNGAASRELGAPGPLRNAHELGAGTLARGRRSSGR